jgi:hypothetical protein
MTIKTPLWQGLLACLLIIHCPCSAPAQRPGARSEIPETVQDAAVPTIALPTQDEGESHVLSPLAESIQVGAVTCDPISPPEPLVTRRDLGLVTAPGIDGQVVHEADKNLFETRATITPAGDYLLMFPEGEHYGGKQGKVNDMVAYRLNETWKRGCA